MTPSAQWKAQTSSKSEIDLEIQAFFERYGADFVELTVGTRSDLEALLDYYAAPLRFIGDSFHLVMQDSAAIIGHDGIGGEIERLHRAHLGSSVLDECHVTVLNIQAALVHAQWRRLDGAGAVIAHFAIVYLLARTPDGWRITTAVQASK